VLVHKRMLSEPLRRLIRAQLGLVTREQVAQHGVTGSVLARLKREGWRVVLPGVLLTVDLEPTRQVRLLAAQLWHGGQGRIDGIDACVAFGIADRTPDPALVHVVLPVDTALRSTGFVKVRRSRAVGPRCGANGDGLDYVSPAVAAVVAAATAASEAAATALLAAAVHRLCKPAALVAAAQEDPPYRLGHLPAALEAVAGGARSTAEASFQRQLRNCENPPKVLYNCLVRLPDGRRVSPDALCEGSGVVQEIDGWSFHAQRIDDFDSTYERRDAMVEAGLIVLASTGRQVMREVERVVARFVRVAEREAGRGLPPGVTVIRRGA
jgi:hypothetical protein